MNPGTCDTCQHCKAKTAPDNSLILICAFNPPVAHAQLVPTQGGVAMQQVTLWPQVTKQDTCGKYTREVKLAS